MLTDHEVLRFPEKGGLRFFTQALAVLCLLLGLLPRTTATLLASFLALALAAMLDGTHPVHEQLVHLLEDVKDTQLRLDLGPGALQSILLKGRAIGNDHLGIESALFEGL